MSQMTNLLAKDDAGTPKEWTFIPVQNVPFPLWRGDESSVPLDAQPRFSLVADKLKNGNYKLTAKLELPTQETLAGMGAPSGYVAPAKTAYVTTAIFTMFVDKRSTIQNRMDALKIMVGMLQGASDITGTGTLDNTSAGSAWVNSTATLPQFFHNVVVPS